jgi:hypothetical protein
MAMAGLTPSKSLHPQSLTPLNATVMPASRVFRSNQQFLSQLYPVLPAAVSPQASYAVGPGLDTQVAGYAGIPSNFTVYSVDDFGNARLNGGDLWGAVLSQHCKHFPSSATLYAHFSNLQNGTYYAEYTATVSGRYWLSIVVANSDGVIGPTKPVSQLMTSPYNIKNSPFLVLIQSGQVDTAACRIIGNLENAVAGFSSFVLLIVQDIFGNFASGLDAISFEARLNMVQYDDVNIAGRSQTPSRPSVGNVSFAGTIHAHTNIWLLFTNPHTRMHTHTYTHTHTTTTHTHIHTHIHQQSFTHIHKYINGCVRMQTRTRQ